MDKSSTAAELASDAIYVEPAESKTPAFDPRDYEIRWGVQVAQRDKILNPRDCGIARVPYGRIFPIISFSTPREVHSTDDTMPKEQLTVIAASEAERVLRESLAGEGVQENSNWGLRTGYIGDGDVALKAVLNEILLPKLSRIRQVCEQLDIPCPIAPVCEASEDLDFEPRESCPTCWQKWLSSTSCELYAGYIADAGMAVVERDTRSGELVNRTVKPSLEEFQAAREMVRQSITTGLRTLHGQWEKIAAEIEKPDKSGRHDILDFEHSYRKDLHQGRPQDRQVALMDRVVTKIGNAPVGVASDGTGRDPLLEMMAKSQMQTNQLLARIEAKIGGLAIDPILADVPDVPEAPVAPLVEDEGSETLSPGAAALRGGE